jgi:hypothetical protein
MKKTIFTCLFDDYDELREAPNYPGWDCIMFSDRSPKNKMGWQIRKVERWDNPKKQSRHYKIISHIHLSEYDLVCYIDANVELIHEPPSHPIWTKHGAGRNLFQEAKHLIASKLDSRTVIDRQMIFYSKSGIKVNIPVFQNGFFVREHNDKINRLHEEWWSHIEQFSHRDSISLPYAIKKTNIWPENFQDASVFNVYAKIACNHLGSSVVQSDPISVHHITPGRADKNIGKAINDLIRPMPEQDWICLRDVDTIPVYHEKFFEQCENIANSGNFDLVGCITNRVGLERQLYKREFSDNSDILHHRAIAEELYQQHGSNVSIIHSGIAGLMMLFSKELWNRVGGFEEGYIVHPSGKYFDAEFCLKVRGKGGKIGVADGIYLFHFYRFNSENPKISTKHLY